MPPSLCASMLIINVSSQIHLAESSRALFLGFKPVCIYVPKTTNAVFESFKKRLPGFLPDDWLRLILYSNDVHDCSIIPIKMINTANFVPNFLTSANRLANAKDFSRTSSTCLNISSD